LPEGLPSVEPNRKAPGEEGIRIETACAETFGEGAAVGFSRNDDDWLTDAYTGGKKVDNGFDQRSV
jgi:hypothetical protein